METDWTSIRAYSTKWFEQTLADLNAYKPPTLSASGVQCLAMVQLVRLKEYVDLAIDGFMREKYCPGLALLRVVYESAIWIQWCILDEDPSCQIQSWRKYTFEEWKKFLKEFVDVYPHRKDLLVQLQQRIDTDFQNVEAMDFGAVCSAFFRGIQVGDGKTDGMEQKRLMKMPYVIYRELSHFAHAHPSLEEHIGPNGEVTNAPMPERTPYFAAMAILHLIWPIRLFIGQGNEQLKSEFEAFRLAESQPE